MRTNGVTSLTKSSFSPLERRDRHAMLVSRLSTAGSHWVTSPEYQQPCSFAVDKFLQVTDLLLENPNLNSTHLFRADILLDSTGRLKSVFQKERRCQLEDG